MKIFKRKYNITFLLLLIIFFLCCCSRQDEVHYTPPPKTQSTDPIDLYIKQKLTDPYNSRVIWRWSSKLIIDRDIRMTQPQRKVVIPTVDIILKYWIGPIEKAKNGRAFLKKLFPPEFIFAGSALYHSNGQAYSGLADAGVTVTLTSLDSYSPDNKKFILQRVQTMHHEFTHIVNQRTTEGVPENYSKVNTAYTGANWINLEDKEVLKDGYVSAYGSENPAEDFAEMVSTYLILSDDVFNETYIALKKCSDAKCEANNTGRGYIAKKLQIAKNYYQSNYGVSLDEIKANLQVLLNKL